MTCEQAGASASIEQPDYWWYKARSRLLREVLADKVRLDDVVLDVGSADGPSVDWLRSKHRTVAMDIDPRGLAVGDVCGSALRLPFGNESFGTVCAFDVLEHCHPEGDALAEMSRVLKPGGYLLLTVPAYTWAWTDFDVEAGHHRRYTKRRLHQALTAAGFEVERVSYLFAGTFPAFVAERGLRKLRDRAGRRSELLPTVPSRIESVLMGLSRLDERALRRGDLPFGSSVVAVAR